VPIFIGRGAPFSYKTTNIFVRVLFAGNDGLEDISAADDPNGLFIDLDRVNDRTNVHAAIGSVTATMSKICFIVKSPHSISQIFSWVLTTDNSYSGWRSPF
jgi:hypothetical protein